MPRILIVDDNHDLADNLAELLEHEGYTVETAYSGERAIELATGSVFDAILTDVRMPGISGVELIKRLRSFHGSTSFLLMTAHSSDAVLSEAVRAGVRAVLTKPVDMERLLARLPLGAVHVLVLADERGVGDSLVQALTGQRYVVRRETRVSALRRRLGELRFDAVVVDAGLSPAEVAELLHLLGVERVPALFLVDRGAGAEALATVPSGANIDVLTRPLADDALLDSLRVLVAHSGVR